MDLDQLLTLLFIIVARTVFFLGLYQVKHWVCDYPLQRPWMLGKFAKWPAWVAPLAAHAAVHGAFTFFIVWAFFGWHSAGAVFGLKAALADAAIHFVVDRIKASPKLGGRWKALSAKEYGQALYDSKTCIDFTSEASWAKTGSARAQAQQRLSDNRMFWNVLGLDQMAHHLTHYGIVLWATYHWLGL